MQVSHSRIDTFEGCPFRYDLRYNQGIKTIPPDEADNALFLGTALHTGLEKGVEAAIHEYFMQYPIITDAHINEAIKLEVMIAKAAELLPEGEFEVNISDDDFTGFIDLLAPVEVDSPKRKDEICDECALWEDCGCSYGGYCPYGKFTKASENTYDLYDFKYSNNVDKYKDSVQVHLYKYFFEKLNPGKKIRNMFYLCVPKVNIKQKKTETLGQFRQRIQEELTMAEPNLIQVEYDQSKVLDWMFSVKHTVEAVDFPRKQSWLCKYCEYAEYCQKGETYMLLPKNERRNIERIEKKVIWLYGSPFSGKTTFANHFPDPLMLNTDGNIKFVDAPYIGIKDKIEVTGRMTKKTFAWDIFKDIISELEKKENDFKTIVVDLLEDLYEYCRLYMYDQMGITHESDDTFRAWDKVTTEFLSTLKRLMVLDYENIILISHEDATKDITKKGGDKLTSIKPNLRDKVATKVAGMVDIVARVVADDNVRTLSFKSNEVIFGGGRLTTKTNEIALDYDAFLEVYDEANKAAVASLNGSYKADNSVKPSKGTRTKVKEETATDSVSEAETKDAEQDDVEARLAEVIEAAENAEPNSGETVEATVENKPKTRTRRTRN